MRRRRTEIVIETDEVLVLRSKAGAARRGWCEGCGSEVELVTPEAAALAAGATTRKVYRLVESGAFHFFETPAGGLLICARSIPAA